MTRTLIDAALVRVVPLVRKRAVIPQPVFAAASVGAFCMIAKTSAPLSGVKLFGITKDRSVSALSAPGKALDSVGVFFRGGGRTAGYLE